METTTIAVDAMGGYGGPEPVVRAVGRLSLQRRADDADVYFVLVGDEARIGELLVQCRHNPERLSVVHAPHWVRPSEPAREGLHAHPEASITQACRLVASREADAVVTTGHPGAAVVSALHHFGMIPGIPKAALAAVFPTPRPEDGRRFSLILDVGATVRASADDLVKFALMGSAYARIISGLERPSVGLLSISREPGIGPAEIVRAHESLRQIEALHFVGNVEGHQIALGEVDVIVCEGFAGDIAIKVLEGFADAAFAIAEQEYQRKFAYRMGLRLLAEGLKKIKTAVDFEEYGGAPLLGIDRVLIVADPRSGSRAVENAVKLALKSVRAELPTAIAAMLR